MPKYDIISTKRRDWIAFAGGFTEGGRYHGRFEDLPAGAAMRDLEEEILNEILEMKDTEQFKLPIDLEYTLYPVKNCKKIEEKIQDLGLEEESEFEEKYPPKTWIYRRYRIDITGERIDPDEYRG